MFLDKACVGSNRLHVEDEDFELYVDFRLFASVKTTNKMHKNTLKLLANDENLREVMGSPVLQTLLELLWNEQMRTCVRDLVIQTVSRRFFLQTCFYFWCLANV